MGIVLEVKDQESCPHCGEVIERVRRPMVTVDIIIECPVKNGHKLGIVLIERRYPPHGWALPGGFVEYGETVEKAAVREAKEETSLDVKLKGLLGLYSDPSRDARGHTISAVYLADGSGVAEARDDAKKLKVYPLGGLPKRLAFDHSRIIGDYIGSRVA